jgi:transcriptional regulator with XRE-family HTH domain
MVRRRVINLSIGENIKKYRIERGLTQTDFANLIGKSIRMVQKYESDEVVPSIKKIENIATAIGVDPSEIMGSAYIDAIEMNRPDIDARTKEFLLFKGYLSSIGYTVNVNYERVRPDKDDYASMKSAVIKVVDSPISELISSVKMSKGGLSIEFTRDEYNEMQSVMRNTVESYMKEAIKSKL